MRFVRIFARRRKVEEQKAADSFAVALEQALGSPAAIPPERPELVFARDLKASLTSGEPSYFYQYSAKSRFLEAMQERARPKPRTSVLAFAPRAASMTGASALAAGVGVLAFGFITADEALPGDWNYGFKTSIERAQVFLARDEERKDELYVSIAEERLEEGERMLAAGNLDEGDLDDLHRDLAHIVREVNDREKVKDIERTLRAFSDEIATDPNLTPALQTQGAELVTNVLSDADTIDDDGSAAVSTGPGDVGEPPTDDGVPAGPTETSGGSAGGPTDELTPPPSPSPEPTTPEPTTPEPTPSPTETPVPTDTPTPTETPTAVPTEEPTTSGEVSGETTAEPTVDASRAR